MKMTIIKKSDRCFIELPAEFMQNEEAEFFKLKDGYYLISVPLGETPPEKQKKAEIIQILGDAEKSVLKRLLSIKFQNRTPENVEKMLSPDEKSLLEDLERKNFINVFRGRKYPGGVYNISDKIYSALYGRETVAPAAPARPADQPVSPTAQPKKEKQAQVQKSQKTFDTLGQTGYLIGSGADLGEIIERHRDDIKNGRIKGLKGFDGKFYIARMDYVERMSPLIMRQLDKERSIDEIAENLKVEPDAVRTVLHILAEAGDVIEKRKGVYAAI